MRTLLPAKYFSGTKNAPTQANLHQRRSNRAQDRQRIPALSLRQREQTDIEQRDVTEKSERIVLVR